MKEGLKEITDDEHVDLERVVRHYQRQFRYILVAPKILEDASAGMCTEMPKSM